MGFCATVGYGARSDQIVRLFLFFFVQKDQIVVGIEKRSTIYKCMISLALISTFCKITHLPISGYNLYLLAVPHWWGKSTMMALNMIIIL